MSNSENMDNFTALYTLYLHFTFGTNSMHASTGAFGILIFLLAFFYKFMLLEFQVKDAAGTIDHVQIASVRLSHKHAGVVQLPIASSGCVSWTLRNLVQHDVSGTNMFTC